MALPQPIDFSSYAPNYGANFAAGQQAVLAPIAQYDAAKQAEWQRQQQAIQLASFQRKQQLDSLLLPYELQGKQLDLENKRVNLQIDQANPLLHPMSQVYPPGQPVPLGQAPGTVSNIASDGSGNYSTTGTVFAGMQDLDAYNRAKASGATELQALAVGDNGLGKWGDKTATTDKNYLALPPSFIAANGLKPGDAFNVSANGKTAVATLADVLPDNAKNGAGIDVNPGTATALGLDPNHFKGGITFSRVGPAGPNTGPLNTSGISMAPIGQSLAVAQDTSSISPLASAALAQRAGQVMTRQQGYYNPDGTFVQSNDPTVRSYRLTEAPNQAQSRVDQDLLKKATRAKLEGDWTLDANGMLSEDDRRDIQSGLAQAKTTGGVAVPKAILTEAIRFNVPTSGRTPEQIGQDIEDKQIQTGEIPPHLIPIAQQLAKDAETHPALKHYPTIREAKESLDAGYNSKGQAGGFGDMAMVEGFQRMVNPGAVVRTQTMQQMLAGAGYDKYADLGYLIDHFKQGDKFADAARDRMKQLADDIYERATKNAKPQLDLFSKRAKAYGIRNPDAFVGTAMNLTQPVDAQGNPDDAPRNTLAGTLGQSGNAKTASADPANVPAGTIANQGGKRYQKQTDGSWKEL